MEEDIKFLDLDMIGPSQSDPYNKVKASKIVLIGKPGTGKSMAIAAILYHMRHRINQGIVISGTEDTNQAYSKFFPSLFVYDEYSEDPIRRLIDRQKQVIKARVKNPWAVLIIDDCSFNKSFYETKLQKEIFKNSRHWYILYILALQYARDIPPIIQNAIDGVFLFREHRHTTRKILYENYASVIPTFKQFCDLLEEHTQDHGVLFIDNMTATNDWEECVYYWRAEPPPEGWHFGDYNFWKYHVHHSKQELDD